MYDRDNRCITHRRAPVVTRCLEVCAMLRQDLDGGHIPQPGGDEHRGRTIGMALQVEVYTEACKSLHRYYVAIF